MVLMVDRNRLNVGITFSVQLFLIGNGVVKLEGNVTLIDGRVMLNGKARIGLKHRRSRSLVK